jgi:hypothetical protein
MSECASRSDETTSPRINVAERRDPEARARIVCAVLRGELDSQTAGRSLWMMPEAVEDIVGIVRAALAQEVAQREVLHREVTALRTRMKALVERMVTESAPPPGPSSEGAPDSSPPPSGWRTSFT